MLARLRSWWQIIKHHSFIATGICVVLIALIAFILATYRFGWSGTGFLNKTLWDWLQLLIIPLVLAVAALLFNLANSRTEQQIALDNQREAALQTYLDKMSELLLHEKLRDSAEKDEVRKIARVRTLTILASLDGNRKRSVLQFLYESGLIDKGMSIIDLDDADLSGAHLLVANLSGANLYRTKLFGADLHSANLVATNLSHTHLTEANLIRAHLKEADLSGAILYGANLSRAFLSGANVSGAWLNGANLSGARLDSTDLGDAHLKEVDLSEAYLHETNLSSADLTVSNLSRADLSGANLSSADLTGANLKGANLHGSRYNTKTITEELKEQRIPLFAQTHLSGLKVLFSVPPTQWPQGFDPKVAGAICVDC